MALPKSFIYKELRTCGEPVESIHLAFLDFLAALILSIRDIAGKNTVLANDIKINELTQLRLIVIDYILKTEFGLIAFTIDSPAESAAYKSTETHRKETRKAGER